MSLFVLEYTWAALFLALVIAREDIGAALLEAGW